MMNDRLEMPDDRDVDDVAQLIQLFQGRPLFVSTIKVRLTHRIAFLMFHEGQTPFTGIAVGLVGITAFEGELLRAGLHRFSISEMPEADKVLWILQSEDGSFRVTAEEILILREKGKPE